MLPPRKLNPTIFVPVAAEINFGLPLERTVGIPFSGQYWLFRSPARRPPQGAVIRRGTPAALSFHTPDRWPMEMEAHQKLDTPIGIKCCSAIQMMIENRETDANAAAGLELTLIDSALPNSPLNLGAPASGVNAEREQTLTYRMPSVAWLTKFDELKVNFRRGFNRADKSAKIAIERFVLVP